MRSHTPLEEHLDELERRVLQRARAARAAGSVNEKALLSAVHRRIALLPLSGLPPIEIPPIPGGAPIPAEAGVSTPTVAKASWTKGSGVALEAGVTKPAALIPMKPLLALSQLKLLSVGVVAVSTAVLVPVLGLSGSSTESTPPAPPSTLEVDDRSQDHVEEILERNAPPPDMHENVRPDSLPPKEARPVAERLAAPGLSSPWQRALPGHNGISSDVSTPRGSPVEEKSKNPHLTLDGERSNDSPRMTEDLHRLREAQKALQTGAPSKALELVLQIAKGPGWSALGPELQLTQILALCALGDGAGATRVALALSQSSGGNIYTARLRSTCVGAEPSDQ